MCTYNIYDLLCNEMCNYLGCQHNIFPYTSMCIYYFFIYINNFPGHVCHDERQRVRNECHVCKYSVASYTIMRTCSKDFREEKYLIISGERVERWKIVQIKWHIIRVEWNEHKMQTIRCTDICWKRNKRNVNEQYCTIKV